MNFSDILNFDKKVFNENIYINSLTHEKMSREAYMTIVDCNKLISFIRKIKNDYTKQEWDEIINYYMGREGYAPTNSVMISIINNIALEDVELE